MPLTPGSQLTVGEILERYGEIIFGRRQDMAKVIQRCRHALAPLLDVPVHELDPQRIAGWREEVLLNHHRESTLINYESMLKQVMDFACSLDLLAQFPKVELPRLLPSPPRQFRKLTRHDHWAILQELNTHAAAMRAARDRCNADRAAHRRAELPSLSAQTFVGHLPVFYLLLRETGVGYTQCVDLPWADISLPSKEWTVTSRSGCRWQLPLSDLCWETMSRWREQCPSDSLVFPGRNPDVPIQHIRVPWVHLLQQAGLPLITFENLRRDFVERIAEQGATCQQQFYLTGRYPRRLFGKARPALEMEALRLIVNKASRALLQHPIERR